MDVSDVPQSYNPITSPAIDFQVEFEGDKVVEDANLVETSLKDSLEEILVS